MTAALATMAPELIKESKDLIKAYLDRHKEQVLELGFDRGLGVVKPDGPDAVFKLRITPALIEGAAGIVFLGIITWAFLTGRFKWDPFGLAKLKMPQLAMPGLPSKEGWQFPKITLPKI